MSNLKLPDMSYSSLIELTSDSGDKWKKIAYATFIRRCPVHSSEVMVKHHDSVIATINGGAIEMDNHGYHSSTTSNRLNKIARDNDLEFFIAIRNFEMVLLNSERKVIEAFNSGRFLY